MDPAYLELIKLWGPLSIGWIVAAYLIKFIMDRYNSDIESRSKLAMALDSLAKAVERQTNAKN